MSTPPVYFLSWVRSGLAAGIQGAGDLDDPGPAAVELPVQLTFGDDQATTDGTADFRLYGPGDVAALAPAAIAAVYPPADSTNAERSWFPYVEFTDPQLPWMMTTTAPQLDAPATPGARRGLAPWLCLVAVPASVAELSPPGGSGLATVTVPAGELPDLSTAWLWTHAQVSAVPSGAEVPTGLSRALCPRRLAVSTAYLACVVPTTDAGVRRGLGQDAGPATAALAPAWNNSDIGDITLPAYYSWTFATGDREDARTMIDLLTPATGSRLGLRPLDVSGLASTSTGTDDPAWIIDLEGAVIDGSATAGRWPDDTVRRQVADALTTRLDTTGDGLRPPLYGGSQAGVTEVDGNSGWLSTLNLDPRYRSAAGAGARLIRAEQEKLVAQAWLQAGSVSAANQLQRGAQLARSAASGIYASTVTGPTALPDDQLLQLAGGALGSIPAAATPHAHADVVGDVPSAATVLATNPSARAAVGTAFRRMTHPTSPIAGRSGASLTGLTRIADGGNPVVPPLIAVSGTTTLTSLTADSAGPVRLRDLTAAVVDQPRLSWETGLAAANRPAVGPVGDALLAPGYLSDLWAFPTALGRSTDWDASPLQGWQAFAATADSGTTPWAIGPVNQAGPGVGLGGSVAVYRWDAPDESPDPAIVIAALRVDTIEYGSFNSWQTTVTVRCELRGDCIPGITDSPVRSIPNPAGPATWPAHTVYTATLSGTPPQSPAPTVHLSSAITMADLEGGSPSIPSVVLAYTVQSVPTGSLRKLVVLHRVFTDADVTSTVTVDLPAPMSGDTDTDVRSLALAVGHVFVVIGRRLYRAAISASTVGAWTEIPTWDDGLSADWHEVAISAADFTGDGNGDLAVLATRRLPSEPGSPAIQGGVRIRYVAPDGSLGTWSNLIEVQGPLSDDRQYLLVGAFTSATAGLRETVTARVRAAAAEVQAVLAPRATAEPPPAPPAVDLHALATSARTALDPASTVPAAVAGRIPAVAGQPDPLAPLLVTPTFAQPLSELLREQAGPALVPGIAALPDDSITMLQSDRAVVEAMLAGANTEFGRELRWRGFPAPPAATFFRHFWDHSDADGDITDMQSWGVATALGHHPPPAVAGSDWTLIAIRGELVRQRPDLLIYSAAAVATPDGKRTVDFSARTDPVYVGNIAADTQLIAFGFGIAQARGDGDGLGRYLVFQERGGGPARFGFDEPATEPPTDFTAPDAWQDLDWARAAGDAGAYDDLTYVDGRSPTLSTLALPDQPGGTAQHYWGYSASDTAHIAARPPLIVVVHFSVYESPAAPS